MRKKRPDYSQNLSFILGFNKTSYVTLGNLNLSEPWFLRLQNVLMVTS